MTPTQPDPKLKQNSGSDPIWPTLHDFSVITKNLLILISQQAIKINGKAHTKLDT